MGDENAMKEKAGEATEFGMDTVPEDSPLDVPYTEEFSDSLGFRQEQHGETAAFLERLAEEAGERMNAFFTPDCSGIEAWEASAASYREKFLSMIGCPPPVPGIAAEPSGARNAEKTGAVPDAGAEFRKIFGDASVEIFRVYLKPANGIRVYGIYMVPAARRERGLPLLVALHGGGGCPEAVCGIGRRANYHDLGYRAVRRGFAVWAPYILMRVGYGGDPDIRPDRWALDRSARALGTSIVGIETFRITSSTRLLLESRPELDPDRIGMAGLSYGGYYALYAAAAMPLVRAAVCSGFYRSFRDAWAVARAEDDDRRHQGLLTTFDLPVVASLVCPGALMIQHGVNDGVIPVADTRKSVPYVRSWYDRLGIPERFAYAEHPGAHEFEPETLLGFLERHV